MHKDIVCNLCGSSEYALIFKAKDLNYCTTDEEFNVVKCKKCSLVYLNPQPLIIERYYPETYMPYKEVIGAGIDFKPYVRRALKIFYGYPATVKTSVNKLQNLHGLIGLNLKDKFFFYKVPYARHKKILDVGCGNGSYLLSLKKLGWDAETQLYGIDFPNEALTHLKEHEHINIIGGNFFDAALPENFFDVVAVRHVLEHLPDPASALKKAFALLKPDGIILINVPNFKSFEAMVFFREKWRHIDDPRHLYHFSPKTLKKLLGNTGFTVERILLKRAVAPFIKSLGHYGYHVPKFVEKYIIRTMLKLFKLTGYSGEILCKATKR